MRNFERVAAVAIVVVSVVSKLLLLRRSRSQSRLRPCQVSLHAVVVAAAKTEHARLGSARLGSAHIRKLSSSISFDNVLI